MLYGLSREEAKKEKYEDAYLGSWHCHIQFSADANTRNFISMPIKDL